MRFMTLAIAQAFDFATFSVMVRAHGVSAEANPLVQSLFLSLGTPAVALSKIALVTLIVALGIAAAARGGKGDGRSSVACRWPSGSPSGSSAASRTRR